MRVKVNEGCLACADLYSHERLDEAAAAAVAAAAAAYEPDYIKSAHTSLICLLTNQRDNIHTLSALQVLIAIGETVI